MEPAWAWRVLGLAPGSSSADVRRAFRVAAQLLHPDRVAALGADVADEAHRRMVELAEAYRICAALAIGAPPPPPRAGAQPTAHGTLRPVGGQAALLLAEAQALLAHVDEYGAHREVVALLEQVADAWPGTAEGDAARTLLVSSVAAANALSARDRANHLVLVVDAAARDEAWRGLAGRDALSIAQVVYRHRLAVDELRSRARGVLAELDDWGTLADDEDEGVRLAALAHLLVRDGRVLVERAEWVGRRERAAYEVDVAAWHARLAAIESPDDLQETLQSLRRVLGARDPARVRG